MEVNFKLEGFEELSRDLQKLPLELQKKALKKSTSEAIKVIRDQAAINAKQQKSAFSISTKLSAATGYNAQSLLGISKKKWYLKFKELGTKSHDIWIKTKRVLANEEGQMFGTHVRVKEPARPFLIPAFDAKYNEAIEKMRIVLGSQIDEVLKK